MRKNLIYSSLLATLYFTGLFATGCESWLPEAHKIDIQQGNRVKPEDLDRLQPGMTREQVKFVLGTPILRDAFHQDRWDYIYYLQPGKENARQSHLSLYFDGDTLVKINREQYQPDAQQSATELK